MKNLITICATGSLALSASLASAQTPSNLGNVLLGSGEAGLGLLDGGALNGSAALQVFGSTQAMFTQDLAAGLQGLGPSAGKGNALPLPTQADALTRLLDNPGSMNALPGLDPTGLPGLASGDGTSLPQDPQALIALLERLQHKAPGDGNAAALPQDPQALIALLEGMQHNAPGNGNAAALPQDPAALIALPEGMQHNAPGNGNAAALLPRDPAALIALLEGMQHNAPGNGNAAALPQDPQALIVLLEGMQHNAPGNGNAAALPQDPQALIVLVEGLQHMAPGDGNGDNGTGITSGGSVLGYAVINGSEVTASFGEATAGNASDALIGGLVSDAAMGSARDGGKVVGNGIASAAMGLDDDIKNSPSKGNNGNKKGARTGRTDLLAGTAAK